MERRVLAVRVAALFVLGVFLVAGVAWLGENARTAPAALPSRHAEHARTLMNFWAWQPAGSSAHPVSGPLPLEPATQAQALPTPSVPLPAPVQPQPESNAAGPSTSPVPPIPAPPPADAFADGGVSPFPGSLLIADASNHRLIEVTPDRQIVWSFPPRGGSAGGASFRFPDDAFFSPDGRYVAVSEESNQTVVVIDYQTRQVVWQYGEPGHAGSDLRHFSYPDDARILPDGRVAVADIRNCRIMLISWDQQTVQALGRPGDCSGRPGSFAEPNGIEPLPNGDLLISEIRARRVSEIDLDGRVVRSVVLPVHYPSDPFLTPRDTLIVADYHSPGRVIEADWQGHVLWSYPPAGSTDWLDKTSIAMELPNGNIAICDDHRHRLLIVDRSGRIVWQYGVKGVPGGAPGYLKFPDGFDLHLPVNLAKVP